MVQWVELPSALLLFIAVSTLASSVAGSRTWSNVMGSGSEAILSSVAVTGNGSLVAAGSGSPSAVGSGFSSAQWGDGEIGNKPVTISGDPSKQPDDNIKTKLKNISTTTTQEACGRESTTSQALKGTNQLLWKLPPLYRTSSTHFMLVSRLTPPPTQGALQRLLQKRWVHSPVLSRM